MVRIFGTKKRPPLEIPDQPVGVYLGLPSFRRFLFLVFIALPLVLGLWYIWIYLLNFWITKAEQFVEIKQETDNYLLDWDIELHYIPESTQTCSSHSFKCTPPPWDKSTKILPWTKRCDGIDHCWDGLDEKNCTTCMSAFSCPHKDGIHQKCLQAEQVCDGVADCADLTDESLYCNNFNRTCPHDLFPCTSHSQQKMCVPIKLFCSGEFHCNLEEFECEECSGWSRMCMSKYEWKDRCLAVQETCDGEVHCEDNRDENLGFFEWVWFFHCNATSDECPGSCKRNFDNYMDKRPLFRANEYLEHWMRKASQSSYRHSYYCSDGLLHSFLYACDGEHKQCDGNCLTCMSHAFHCGNEERSCIPESKVCDGHNDCKNGKDEQNCTSRLPCDDQTYRCNGFCNCPDCRDETNCVTCKNSSTSQLNKYSEDHWEKVDEYKKVQNWIELGWHAFRCPAEQTCISIQKRCDGIEHCSDGYDERLCSCAECLLHPFRMYICQEGMRCFRYDDVCDEHFESRCPNATQLDRDHCSVLGMEQEKLLLN